MSSLYAYVLRDQLRAHLLVIEHGETHSATPKNLLELVQTVPQNVTAEALVKAVNTNNVRLIEQRPNTGRPQHVHQNKVISAN